MTRFEHALKGASLSLGLRYTKRRAWARLQQPLDKRFAGVARAYRMQARGHLGRIAGYSRLMGVDEVGPRDGVTGSVPLVPLHRGFDSLNGT
jgi:hypothetical protein